MPRITHTRHKGFTLVELVIAVGLFALIMVLVSGAYLTMISATRHTQGVTAGIDNLSFALETMVRTIRTNRHYGCPNEGVNCPSGGSTFTVKDRSNNTITYTLSGGAITQTSNGSTITLTDSSITVTSLQFYSVGAQSFSGSGGSDTTQARVTVRATGTISSGPGKTLTFTVETGATMRGSDI